MLPILITLAGCSTISITGRSPPCSPPLPSTATPSGPTMTTLPSVSGPWFVWSLMVLVCPLLDGGRIGGRAAPSDADGGGAPRVNEAARPVPTRLRAQCRICYAPLSWSGDDE